MEEWTTYRLTGEALEKAASWGLPISDKRRICKTIEDIEEFVQLEKEYELPGWRACLSDILIEYISSCESHTEGMICCNGDYDPRISKVYVTKEQYGLLVERFGKEEIDKNIEIWS